MSLPESLERAASELASLADRIRPANGDPDRLLEELGSEEARTLLGWMLRSEPDDAGLLVEAWSESEAGIAALLGLSEEGLPKPARKLLRRAHHRLRSQGHELPPPDAPARSAPPRRVGIAEPEFEAACLSVPDFRGARVGYLADPHPAGGARLFEIRFDEARGILEFKVYNAGRSKVRGFLRSLASAQAQRLFDVPRSALCALVRRASHAQPDDRPLPTGFVEWRGRLFSAELEKEATPGALAREALSTGTEGPSLEAAADAVVARIEAGEIGPWPPSTRWVSEWMEKGRGDVEGLEADARAAAIEAWTAAVSEDLSQATDSALLARRLEELAWIDWRSEASASARELLAVTDALPADEAVAARLARARVESLFAPFLGELRVIEERPLEDVAVAD